MESLVTRLSLLVAVRDPSNHAAWREFDETYRDLVLRFARKRGLQLANAEDVLQIVMVSLVRTLPKFVYDPRRGTFRSYLYRIVRNAISAYMSRPTADRGSLEASVLESLAADSSDAVDEAWEQEWIDHHYRLAMKRLREIVEPQSVAVFERLLAGASIEETAAAFGMTAAAVHKVKQRVRGKLQAFIEEQVRQEDERIA